jgi:hypothetical protein
MLRRRFVRTLTPLRLAVLVLIVSGAGLVVPAAAQPPEGAGPQTRSEVVSLRSEYGKVFREADGTLTAELGTRPVHYELTDGSWAAVDPTLVATDVDGFAWRNAGGPLEFAFASRAGSGELARVESAGGSVAFALKGAVFPALGVVEGSRITYAGVIPGVDLVYESRPEALKELIVLREPPRDPVAFRFLVMVEGLEPRPEGDGSITLVNREGKIELVIPAGSMTDSSIDPRSGESAFSSDVDFDLAEEKGGLVLTVTPDLEWLQAPARVYPVEVDPSVTLYATLDTFVQTGITSGQSGSDELKTGTFDGGSTKARSFVRFNISSISGKQILSAAFSLYEFHSWSCAAREARASRVTESWGSGIVWSNQPSVANAFDTLNVAKGYSGSCPAGRIAFDATAPVGKWADGSQPNYGFRVRAGDETDNYGWKKFRSEDYGGTGTDPRLIVNYNSYPTSVTDCTPTSGTISSDATPTLSCRYNDPDSGDNGAVSYQICANSTCSVPVLAGSGPTVQPGARSSWTVPGASALEGGETYWWRARSDDGGPTKGPWSTTRTYLVDNSEVALFPVDLIHWNGAELFWTEHGGVVPFGSYEVHRSPTAGFTPSPSTLLKEIDDPEEAWFADTTGMPGETYTYKLVANDVVSGAATVTLPDHGETRLILDADPEAVDATFVTDEPGMECANAGTDSHLRIGATSQGRSRSLLRFDLSELGVSSTISSATLSLWNEAPSPAGASVGVHRVVRPWFEGAQGGACVDDGGSTWLEAEGESTRASGIEWDSPGGDFQATPVAVVASPSGSPRWEHFDVTQLVGDWVDDETSNHGLLLKTTTEDSGNPNSLTYTSDDSPLVSSRPKLAVVFTTDQYQDAILGLQPRGYWRLGDAAQSVVALDSSGRGHNGTYRTATPGQLGALDDDADMAAHFPATAEDQDVLVSDHDDLDFGTGDFTWRRG